MPLKSIYRKGFEGRFSYGMRSRSHRVAEDTSMMGVDALRQSCWANLPPELLRDVLMRIEESESTWPLRKNVVACAGVCRSWRDCMKEIVRTLEVSEKLTFPISVKQPGPRNTEVQCFIKRNRSTQTYRLYLNLSQASNDEGKFLLAAQRCRRPTYTDYVISLNAADVTKASGNYIGKLRSNVLGTKFTIYDAQPPNTNIGSKVTKSHPMRLVGMKQVSPRVPAGNYPLAHISYESNALGARGPRRMHCIMNAISISAIGPEGVVPILSVPLSRSKSSGTDSLRTAEKDEMLVLKNKTPTWHEQLQCWCLNFNGRVTVASVKNFQLVENGQEEENVILQFGKVGKDVFTMDYKYPISAFQAFAICLSSFDTKIACE